MTRYYALALITKYWKPGSDYQKAIEKALDGKVSDGDFVVISEKALSTAKNYIVDENTVKPSLTAKFIAAFWMPIAWGFLLGVVCHFGQRLLHRLRRYPLATGSRHKQVALQFASLPQALMFGSEGGIDGSNLPYSLVSLPLSNAFDVAETIALQILKNLGKHVTVLIVDSDKTYSFRNFHFTPRPKPINGISSIGGIVAYVVGRMFKLRKRPTPIAVAGTRLEAETVLTVANVSDRARGPGSGATVWDMAARFKVPVTGVSWDMLDKVKHKPIVIVRRCAHL